MSEWTPKNQHDAEMRSALLHRRSNRSQERAMLVKAPDRIKEIDAELALIAEDLTRYGHEDPKPPEAP